MKTNSQWLKALQPGLLLILAVWLFRLISGAADMPRLVTIVASLSAATPMAIILTTVLMHSRQQADYRRVFSGSFLLVCCTQLLVVATIVFTLLTGIETIYTAPEFSVPDDPNHLLHIGGHLVSIPFGTLVGGGVGSVVLWLLRRTGLRAR